MSCEYQMISAFLFLNTCVYSLQLELSENLTIAPLERFSLHKMAIKFTKMMNNNRNIGLVNFGMYTKFGLILLICFQDITKNRILT